MELKEIERKRDRPGGKEGKGGRGERERGRESVCV